MGVFPRGRSIIFQVLLASRAFISAFMALTHSGFCAASSYHCGLVLVEREKA